MDCHAAQRYSTVEDLGRGKCKDQAVSIGTCMTHLVASGGAVRIPQLREHLPQGLHRTVLVEEAAHVPCADEKPAQAAVLMGTMGTVWYNDVAHPGSVVRAGLCR